MPTTIEELERRISELERKVDKLSPAVVAPVKDWKTVVGISEMTDFSRQMQSEMDAIREADRLVSETEDLQ